MGTPDLVSQCTQYAATSSNLLISRSTLQLSHLSDIASQPFMSKLVCSLVVTLTLHASNDSITDFGKSQLQADSAVVQHVYRIDVVRPPLKQSSLAVDFIA